MYYFYASLLFFSILSKRILNYYYVVIPPLHLLYVYLILFQFALYQFGAEIFLFYISSQLDNILVYQHLPIVYAIQ